MHQSFIAAVSAQVAEIHATPGPFSTVNGFTIHESTTQPGTYRVEGEAWTFYLVNRGGWVAYGWMESEMNGVDPRGFA